MAKAIKIGDWVFVGSNEAHVDILQRLFDDKVIHETDVEPLHERQELHFGYSYHHNGSTLFDETYREYWLRYRSPLIVWYSPTGGRSLQYASDSSSS